jgi:tetratricopeptide (TPR) repeat protein
MKWAMAETWVPDEPPLPPPPAKSRQRRTLVLWVVLILVFVSIYAAFDESPKAGHTATIVAVTPWWVWPACIGCFALPVAFFVYLLSGSRRFNQQMASALEALADGQFARAAEALGAVARRYRARPNLWSPASYSQGYALIRAGNSAAAAGVLLGIERWPNLQIDGIRRLVTIELARAYAIGGDLASARRWLDTARARPTAFGDAGQETSKIADVEGLLLCRAGELADAIRHYDEKWERLESRLPVRDMRAVWLLRAFAATGVTGPRDGAAAEPWLRLLRATHASSLSWLTAQWPELATFAAAHDLGLAPPRTAASDATAATA